MDLQETRFVTRIVLGGVEFEDRIEVVVVAVDIRDQRDVDVGHDPTDTPGRSLGLINVFFTRCDIEYPAAH